MRKKLLYSYCIPVDDGAAPNPYWGICTLAICKPVIRRNAQVGDWVVGTGSTGKGLANKVVYAMEVTSVKTLAEYNSYCERKTPNKIPDLLSDDITKRAGDCIYFQRGGGLKQRRGVHNARNYKTDVKGENVLLSEHFYYFGKDAVELPEDLRSIVKQGQGHRSHSNDYWAKDFITWVTSDKLTKPYMNALKSEPHLLRNVFGGNRFAICSKTRCKVSVEDENCKDIC